MSVHSSDTLVSFGGNTVKIISDHSLFASTLQTHFRHCTSQQMDIVATFQITALSNNKFTGSVDGNTVFSSLDFEPALWVVMNEVITHLNAVCNRGMIFHAAALAHAEDAIILCGKSGSGKSSLAAWLTGNRFQYLTDEVIEMPLETNQINGLARSIILKSGSAFIFQRRLPDKNTKGAQFFKDGSAWVDPVVFHPNGVTTVATPRVLVFPRYAPNSPLKTVKLTDAEALFHLMQNLVNARNLPGHGIDSAAHLARQVKAYDLAYSDIEAAADWIRQIYVS